MSIDINTNSAASPIHVRQPAPVRAEPVVSEQNAAPQAVKKPEASVDTKEMMLDLEESLDRLNQQMKSKGRNLSFSRDEVLNRPVVIVKNTETGEVVRQIPNETVIRLAHSIHDAKGLFHNEKI